MERFASDERDLDLERDGIVRALERLEELMASLERALREDAAPLSAADDPFLTAP